MKVLRLFNVGIPLDVKSTAYVDIECSDWQIANQVLHIMRPNGTLYVPLANIGAFSEILEANSVAVEEKELLV